MAQISWKGIKMKGRHFVHLLMVLFFLAAGGAIMAHLIATKPQAKRRRPEVPVPLVRCLRVHIGPHQVVVRGEGTVRAVRTVGIVPQVSGKVIYVSPKLLEGGEFEEGEVLLKIDPTDWRLALESARAEVAEAKSQLKLLEEEAKSSREEWRLAGRKGPPPPLLVKEPQIAAARARLEAARAHLRKAELDLERTTLNAPFPCRVVEVKVGLGQYVTPGQVLASVYSREAVEITVHLPLEELAWIKVPGINTEGGGSSAQIRVRMGGRELSWPGHVVRAEGKVDERTRLLPVVVRVEDPFRRRPPLLPGLYARVRIQGRRLQGVSLIPRSALRPKGTVWVLGPEGKLQFRRVVVIRFEDDCAIISRGLMEGERVIITSLKEVTEGMRVKEAR